MSGVDEALVEKAARAMVHLRWPETEPIQEGDRQVARAVLEAVLPDLTADADARVAAAEAERDMALRGTCPTWCAQENHPGSEHDFNTGVAHWKACAEAAEERLAAVLAGIEALHVRRDDPVYPYDCLEGDCDHVPEGYDGSEYPTPDCPRMADAVCAHCADQTLPDEMWEHRIREAAFWPCETLRALASTDGTALARSRSTRICYCPDRGDNYHSSGAPGCVMDKAEAGDQS